jgi:hypothetical protein
VGVNWREVYHREVPGKECFGLWGDPYCVAESISILSACTEVYDLTYRGPTGAEFDDCSHRETSLCLSSYCHVGIVKQEKQIGTLQCL